MKNHRTTSWWLFWGSILTVAYTYLGFPLLVALRALLRPRAVEAEQHTPSVSFIIAAYNEAEIIVRKLDNTLGLEYPRAQIEIIVASDGSSDATNDLVAAYPAPEVRLLALPRQGKNLALNDAVAQARGEILIFSDADSMLEPDALRYLTAPFADPEIGGVGGDYHYAADNDEGSGERTYWSFDRMLKEFQSRAGSMTSATGQIFAMRRALYRPLPLGVTDDFYASVQVPAAHQRLIFEPRAVARGPIAESTGAEFRRKLRVITAGLRGVWLMRHALNPIEYGWFAVQLFSHKVLRRLMVVPLIGIGLSAPLLWRRGWLYRIATLGQFGLHGAGLLGFALRGTRLGRSKVLSLPLFFDMVNVAALAALVNLIRGDRHDIWVPQRGTAETGRAVEASALEVGD